MDSVVWDMNCMLKFSSIALASAGSPDYKQFRAFMQGGIAPLGAGNHLGVKRECNSLFRKAQFNCKSLQISSMGACF